MVYYFAYGSNMDKGDLDKWCNCKGYPPITFLGVSRAKLSGYKLSFNYYSFSRKGGAANIMRSEKDCVYGLLIEMENGDLDTIRKKEGYPCYYDEICVGVKTFDGTLYRDVKTYKVVKSKEKSDHQPPTKDYMELIIRNAGEWSFPSKYIKRLKSIKTKDGGLATGCSSGGKL